MPHCAASHRLQRTYTEEKYYQYIHGVKRLGMAAYILAERFSNYQDEDDGNSVNDLLIFPSDV